MPFGRNMPITVICHGDSITSGGGATVTVDQTYPSLIQASLDAAGFTATMLNKGISGYGFNGPSPGTANLTVDAPANVDPYRDFASILVVFAGTNDVGAGAPGSGNTAYSYFQTYIAARLSAGWRSNRIVCMTMLPRGAEDTGRSEFNSNLISGAGTYGYTLVRLDQDVNIGQFGDQNNLTYYFADGVHPTAAGQQIIANLCYPKVTALIPH